MTTIGLAGRALGEAVLDHVIFNTDQHNQHEVMTTDDVEACGTAGCIVGWTLLLAHGMTPQQLQRVLPSKSDHQLCAEASDLLGVDYDGLRNAVYDETDKDAAISNLKHLMDEAGL